MSLLEVNGITQNIPDSGLTRFFITIVVVRYGAICNTANYFLWVKVKNFNGIWDDWC